MNICKYLVLIPKIPDPKNKPCVNSQSTCSRNFVPTPPYKSLQFRLKNNLQIFANRLKPILPSIVSPNQAAFIPNRLIQDSIIVSHKAFHYLNTKKQGKRKDMVLKLDLNKAYDRVDWKFLINVYGENGVLLEMVTPHHSMH